MSTSPRRGYVWSCRPGDPNRPGAAGAVPWIRGARWSSADKPTVSGSVAWPQATFHVTVHAGKRTLVTSRVPVRNHTGVFPVAASDPAYRYDANPNPIRPARTTIVVPARPHATTPSCLGFGAVGVLTDGTLLFDAMDAQGRDAVAHEVLDQCEGHPAPGGVYHHHSVPSCLLLTTGIGPTLVGYAADGYGIYVEHDAAGHLLVSARLDVCHGRTSSVPWDGVERTIYHYDATSDYPYTLGCFHGRPAFEETAPPPRP